MNDNDNTQPAPFEGPISFRLQHMVFLRRWSDVTEALEQEAMAGDVPQLLWEERNALVELMLRVPPKTFEDLAVACAVLLHDGEGLVDEAVETLRDHARRLLGLPALGAA